MMAEQPKQSDHWLLAAWPGMGNVAVIAATYLIQKMGMQAAGELPPRGRFDVRGVDVHEGVIEKPRLPRSTLYTGASLGNGRRLTVFVGEAQPATGAWEFAHELLERASTLGVGRVVTFASMASQLHPTQQPRVFGVATGSELLDELRRVEVAPLQDGQIGGLNGVLLGAASERGIPGLCLMGEIPFFAAGVPNPKAAAAVVEAFAMHAGFEVDLSELMRHSETIDRALVEMLEKMTEAGQVDPEAFESGESPGGAEPSEPAPERAAGPKPLDYGTRQRIEGLFEEARRDRARAMDLKNELDRLGVFAQYEDRFLDLFKRAE